MRRVTVAAIALLLSLLLLSAPAGASHSGGAGGPRDFAVGGGTTGDRTDPTSVQHVDFAASGGPTTFDPIAGFGGDPVTGHFRAGGEFDQAGVTAFQQEGPVTCLVVEGTPQGPTRARLVYPIKRATASTEERSQTLESLEVLIFLEDHGPPKNGQPVDKLGFQLLSDEDPDEDPPSEQDSECVPPGPPAPFTLTKGNFTIHEGS